MNTKSFNEYLEESLKNDSKLKKEWDDTEAEWNILKAIVRERINQELTQKELANRCGIDQSDISKIERGVYNPSLKVLNRIAKGLGKKLKIEFVD